ncbi:MAG: C69 family dipeptidase [Candidatus Lokiarchaeota archaeon]|nr:C69 family dipeptidase [Candidatus Harpocratesius repetitus]
MCDTIIAAPEATKQNRLLFGKNSDREPDEVQNLVYYPPKELKIDEKIKCTYISIVPPSLAIQNSNQSSIKTHGILLSQPFWMFGGEMGINDHGVVIGNEALMTKVKPAKTGLTGMDMLRIALEISNSAREALEIIIQLLEKYDQGGMCGYRHKLQYMNSFLIGDPKEAYVLETVAKEWAWKKIKGVWSISNSISLEKDYDQCSENLVEYAVQQGWCDSEADFNFYKCYSDKIITWGARAKKREECTRKQLQAKEGQLTIRDFMQILRTHINHPNISNTSKDLNIEEEKLIDFSDKWIPMKGLRMTVCAHATNNLTRATQSVNSMVVDVFNPQPLILTTGASNPCISPYFPVTINPDGLPKEYSNHPGREKYNSESFWWKSEKLHRQIVLKYQKMHPIIANQIGKYENDMLEHLLGLYSQGSSASPDEIEKYFKKVEALLDQWEKESQSHPYDRFNLKLRLYWKKYNKMNGISDN